MSLMSPGDRASAAVASIIWACVLFPVWITGTSLAAGPRAAAVMVRGGAVGAALERRGAGHRSASGSGAAGPSPAPGAVQVRSACGVSV